MNIGNRFFHNFTTKRKKCCKKISKDYDKDRKMEENLLTNKYNGC